MILHHHGRSTDTYLVEDAGTIYRYQTASTAPLRESEVAEDWTTPDDAAAPHEAPIAQDAPVEPDDIREAVTPELELVPPEPVAPEPVAPEPVAPELNGSPEKPLSHVPPAWRALAILAGDDAPTLQEPPGPSSPELPSTFPRSVWRPRRPR